MNYKLIYSYTYKFARKESTYSKPSKFKPWHDIAQFIDVITLNVSSNSINPAYELVNLKSIEMKKNNAYSTVHAYTCSTISILECCMLWDSMHDEPTGDNCYEKHILWSQEKTNSMIMPAGCTSSLYTGLCILYFRNEAYTCRSRLYQCTQPA